ncbi:MAG TPA: protein-methionine-sulfoxide reductase heme-binding subunit MsrQ [Xanthobacteraceae bacterium]|nr:protein-methionine-sulfoxide reductase heme-binding subunit MsrQ [Xanthobacteraceae bacterium]
MPFLREKTGRWSGEKIAAFLFSIAPALWLAGLVAFNQLGARPVTEVLHYSGRWTIRLILAALLITPARRILNWGKLINARRTLGVAAACYAGFHFMLYIVDQKYDLGKVASEIALRFYLTIGFVALLGLIALGVTSTDAAVRRLGAKWGTLHKSVYIIGVLAIIHFALQKKLDIYEPTLMMGLLSWLLAYRALYKWRREVGLAGLCALAIFATIFTMLFEAAWYGVLTGVPFARVLALNFMFDVDIRPAWWVCAASLAVIACYLAAQWLWPREPARVKLRPAE